MLFRFFATVQDEKLSLREKGIKNKFSCLLSLFVKLYSKSCFSLAHIQELYTHIMFPINYIYKYLSEFKFDPGKFIQVACE